MGKGKQLLEKVGDVMRVKHHWMWSRAGLEVGARRLRRS